MIFFSVLIGAGNKPATEDIDIHQLWSVCKLEEIISFEVFKTAVLGQQKIKNLYKKNLLTIIDFSKPSTEKRFFVIDLENKRLIYKCFVAHGKNSGDIYAKSFSNQTGSLKSSPGFFLTAETYFGVHGYSLRLEGLEKGINDNARAREIVIHGAEYVSEESIKKYGRLGRSWGCPALPVDISKEIIDKISGGSCLFIYADDIYYRENSDFFNRK
ncbi:MAG: murein L,D-transpeptidase catalytic domain family protein [Bacteroidales bacterium]